MAISRFLLVSADVSDRVIKDGPFLWDPSTAQFSVPPGLQLIQETVAFSNGYVPESPPQFMVNADSLRSKAQIALTNNMAYLRLMRPLTNAQVIAQVDALTRQINALIRLTLSRTDDISGT